MNRHFLTKFFQSEETVIQLKNMDIKLGKSHIKVMETGYVYEVLPLEKQIELGVKYFEENPERNIIPLFGKRNDGFFTSATTQIPNCFFHIDTFDGNYTFFDRRNSHKNLIEVHTE